MSEIETMVENEDLDIEADDTLLEGVEEVEDESEESLESLDEETEETQPEEEPQPQPSEPGWIKQRVNKAVQKAVAETEARMQAMFEQQMAPIRAKMMEDEAQELVRSRKVSDIETARELVRLRNGQPTVTEPVQQQYEQPRNSQGQYAPKEDPGLTARIDMLGHQADAIKADTGLDVISVFENDEDIREAVKSGEMDFYDVAKMMNQKQPSRRPPAPMRSPNGASGQQRNAIDTMTDEMFDRMEKRISEGARYSLK